MPERLCRRDREEGDIVVLEISGSSAVPARKLLGALQHQVSHLTANNEVKAIILTGTDAGFCLCAPGDDSSINDAAALSGFGQQVMFSLEKIGKPCIAAISGACTGLGLELALACDFIVASGSASFGFPGILDGKIPFCGGTQRLARLLGKSKAKEMIFGGELIDAVEALRIKLVNRLYDDELIPKIQVLMAHICTRSPNAIRVGGEVINAGYDIDMRTACMLERNAFALCFSSFDQREGMQAFLDKRQPRFKGE